LKISSSVIDQLLSQWEHSHAEQSSSRKPDKRIANRESPKERRNCDPTIEPEISTIPTQNAVKSNQRTCPGFVNRTTQWYLHFVHVWCRSSSDGHFLNNSEDCDLSRQIWWRNRVSIFIR
jgi:hypothetical protein